MNKLDMKLFLRKVDFLACTWWESWEDITEGGNVKNEEHIILLNECGGEFVCHAVVDDHIKH